MTKTQKLWNMKGCSKKKTKCSLGGKSRKNRKSRKNGGCWWKKRGGYKCHKCSGNCHLNGKNKKQIGGNCGCGLQLGGQKGGCQTCLAGMQSGGGINNSGTPLVGSPWSPKISNWPGVAGKDGQTNFYSMNKYHVDPQTAAISERNQITHMKQNGGGSRRRRAGGLIPQDLVNLGRSMVYGVGSAYNSLNGYATPVSPLPYKDQLVNTPSAKALGNF